MFYVKIIKNKGYGVGKTNYIIFDLEFNSTKNTKTSRFINEIIEIGAVKLDETLAEVDCFSCTVKPHFSKKLNPYVKKLTNITEELLKDSCDFQTVSSQFEDWCGSDENTVFLSWSDTDLHVLFENYNQLLGRESIDLISNYLDLQKYIEMFIPRENNNQISLKAAAAHYKISTDSLTLHRACDDSRLCGLLLKQTFDKQKFLSIIRNINNHEFYKKLIFKPYIITDLKSENIDKNSVDIHCPVCDEKIKFNAKFNKKTKAFTSVLKCKNCKNKIAYTVRFKKLYDKISTNVKVKEIKQQERH